jgi:hypothetical protein
MAYSYIQDNGTVAICSLLSSVPEGAVYYEVNGFPDRAYRSAWNLQDGQVTLDPVKAAVVDADLAAQALEDGVRVDTLLQDFMALGPAGIENYIDTNSTNLANANEILKKLAKIVWLSSNRQF